MKAFLILAVAFLSACGSTERERTLFFPSDIGGGQLSVMKYSSAYVLVENERLDFSTQKIELNFSWQDRKDDLKRLTGIWMPEVPSGRYVVGAERKEKQIVFILTREGSKRTAARSEPFVIQQWVRFEGVLEDRPPNQALQPTAPSGRG